MDHITQIKKRIEILNMMITTYKSMPHATCMSQKDIDDILFVLSEWKAETELILQGLMRYPNK